MDMTKEEKRGKEGKKEREGEKEEQAAPLSTLYFSFLFFFFPRHGHVYMQESLPTDFPFEGNLRPLDKSEGSEPPVCLRLGRSTNRCTHTGA